MNLHLFALIRLTPDETTKFLIGNDQTIYHYLQATEESIEEVPYMHELVGKIVKDRAPLPKSLIEYKKLPALFKNPENGFNLAGLSTMDGKPNDELMRRLHTFISEVTAQVRAADKTFKRQLKKSHTLGLSFMAYMLYRLKYYETALEYATMVAIASECKIEKEIGALWTHNEPEIQQLIDAQYPKELKLQVSLIQDMVKKLELPAN